MLLAILYIKKEDLFFYDTIQILSSSLYVKTELPIQASPDTIIGR